MAESSITDDKVLSFHDTFLRKSDLELLDDGHWLNDKLIGFAFEYFEYEVFQECRDQVAFLSPDVSQFVKLCDESELDVFLQPLELQQRDLVFLAINNHSSALTVGGSHWSLLVYKRNLQEFHHYDSAGNMNSDEARKVAKKVYNYVSDSSETVTFHDEHTPQQVNSSDCGLYVICIAEHLCQQTLFKHTKQLEDAVSAQTVHSKRKTLKELIKSLASKQT